MPSEYVANLLSARLPRSTSSRSRSISCRATAPADGLEVAEVRATREVRIEGRRLDHRADPAQRLGVADGIAEDPRLA